ncbi:hypothetical protein BOTBODRAFT_48112 [Botryobasidium botryosum FD-172 SS1]|uniref:NAD(P)-binding protein n=1 Tax=Botryobasidium botryosum (strain FD-172 SS1) TaxID=930990 RepID=A0A067M9V5_BOTB1|nr:hypothetical protein BOTBODRAFT_48112 [Botryobasidium botryosum FD-172 SS1]
MPSLAEARASNAAFAPSYRPVAIFVGGTSGIGRGMAEVFARHTGGNAHIIIVGRDKAKANAIIESFPQSSASTYEFIPCDVSLMKNVRACTDSLAQRLPKINILVLTAGMFTMQGRIETEEGLDKTLALHIYSRWKFVEGMLPLLKKAKADGEDARVMTVNDSVYGGPIRLHDLDLKEEYSWSAAASTARTGNDIMITEYARRHPEIAFMHTAPGLVNTPLLSKNYPIIGTLLSPIMSLFATNPQDCAEWMLYPLLSKDFGQGGFRLNNHAEPSPPNKYMTEESRQKVYEKVQEFMKDK